MRTEQQLAAAEQHAHVRLGTAAIAAIKRAQGAIRRYGLCRLNCVLKCRHVYLQVIHL